MKTKSTYLKAITAGFALFAGTISVFAQTENNKQILPEFNSIVVNSTMDIKLSQGTETSISIEEGNIQDKLTAEVKDNVLYLKGKSEDVTINFIKLNKLELLANSDVKSTGQITSDKLELFLTGAASDINLDVKVKELYSSIEGAGDIKLKGTADSHTIEIKGAGDVDAYDLATTTTNVTISGAGDAKVNASQDLKGTINGAGDITYFKEPVNKDIKVNGVGNYGMKGEGKKSVDSDTTRLKFGHKKVLIINDDGISQKRDTSQKKFGIYWAGVGIGINGYLNAYHETKVPAGYDFLDLNYPKSINVSINFWEQKIPIWKKHINIVTGMGFDISNYRFNNKNCVLNPNTNFIAAPYDSAVTFKKNKLTTVYLNVPLLLQFDTNPFGKARRTIHLSAGVVGSLRVLSYTKQEYELGGTWFKPRTHDDFDLNPFRYSAMARIGFGKLDLYASYALNGLFKKNEGPQLFPFTVGITLVGF